MNKRFIFLFIISLVPMTNSYAMQRTKLTNNLFKYNFSQCLGTCAAKAQEHLEKALTQYSPENIALVLDIDDTCIMTKESFNKLTEGDYSRSKYDSSNPPAILQIRNLSLWASNLGIKIYYLSARPDKMPLSNPNQEFVDRLPDHRSMLNNAGYSNITDFSTTLICQKYEEYREDPEQIGRWKQEELARIKKSCSEIVFLDDQETNIDPKAEGQYLVPTPLNQFTPKQSIRAMMDLWPDDEINENDKIVEEYNPYIFPAEDSES